MPDDLFNEGRQMPETKTPDASMSDWVHVPRELTEEEKNPVSSGAVKWEDPLFREKPETEKQQTGKLAVASLMFGIVAVCTVCSVTASAVLGLIALTCGIVSVVRHENGGGIRIAGFVLSGCALFIALLILLMGGALKLGGASVNDYMPQIEQEIIQS